MAFSRAPLAATASCNSSTPPCPGVGFVTNRYIVSGTQTVLVRRIAKTLALNILPASDKYEGDSVTFVAYSTDNRPVSVREWIWRDTSGVTSLVPCYGASTQCRWVPPSSGMMYVRARVGTNPYIEQAARWLDLLPVEFTVSVSPSPALMLIDTLSIVPQATPARPISNLMFMPQLTALRRTATALSTPSGQAADLYEPICTNTPNPRCRARAVSGGIIRVQAVVNGHWRQASVSLEVTPLMINAQFIDSSAVNDTNLSQTSPKQCPTHAGGANPALIDVAAVATVANLRHPLAPNIDLGPGIVTTQPPYSLGRQLDYPHYPSGLPFGDFIPYRASLNAVAGSSWALLPPGFSWRYLPDLSHGVEYRCNTWFDGNEIIGTIRYNRHLNLTFLAVRI